MSYFKFLNKILLLFYLIILFGVLFYVFVINKSNHTGFNIFIDSTVFFIISIFMSLYLRTKVKVKKDIKINNFHFVILIIYFCLIIICDIFNIMIGYSEWIQRGQPNKYYIQ
jgi:cell division protein FtsW (lipid II flippase)